MLWIAHARWLDGVRPRGPARPRAHAGLSDATLARLGWMHAPARRRSAFANFPETPPPGVTRIGCYGDSLTWGAEVADGFEFPALLGDALRAAGVRDVEVLDFGVPGYGLHQTAILHAATAARWHVDRTILFAQWFWPERDWAFTPPWDPDRAVHARFVPHGDGVRRLDPLGATPDERIARYQAFVPARRYLRHDARPPAFLRGFLPAGRDLVNPFFAGPATADLEARATYPVLLRRLGTRARPLDVLHTGGVFVDLAAATASDDVRFHPVALPAGFPFFARGGHLSSFGNRWFAARVADVVLGRPPSPPPVRVLPAADAGARARDVLAIGALDALAIRLDDRAVGEIVAATASGSGVKLHARRRLPADARWLVGFAQDAGSPLPDAVFVTADSAALPTAWLVAGGRRHPLPVLAAGQALALARVDVCTAAVRGALGVPSDAACELATPRRERWRATASIAVGDVRVLEVGIADGTVLVRPAGPHFLVRARGDAVPDLPDAGGGDVWLTGRDATGVERRARLARWARPDADPRPRAAGLPATPASILVAAPGEPRVQACRTCDASS